MHVHGREREEMKFNLMENFILMVSNYLIVKDPTGSPTSVITQHQKITFPTSPSYKNMTFSHISNKDEVEFVKYIAKFNSLLYRFPSSTIAIGRILSGVIITTITHQVTVHS